MRDNRLAATLIQQKRDVVLIPLYTPLRTDETDVSTGTIYYGGINVYLEQLSSLYRKLPNWVTGLLDKPALLNQVGRFAGKTKPQKLGALTVSVLKGQHGAQQKELGRLIDGLKQLKPDLINLPNLMFTGIADQLKKVFDVPILCTLSGEDIFLDQLDEPYKQQAFDLIREKSKNVDGFIAVTEYFASHAQQHFSLPVDRIHVVPMGIHVEDFSAANSDIPGPPLPPDDAPFTIGYLARICPEKGLEQLCQSLIDLRTAGLNCRVIAAGYLSEADRPYLDQIYATLEKKGQRDSFEYIGEVNRTEKIEFLRSIHVLSVPTVYKEAKGFYILEALAACVPVVQPDHGSFPELIRATKGGMLYDALSPDALTKAIIQLMDDADLRQQFGRQGQKYVQENYTDKIMAEKSWSLFEQHVR